MSKSRGLRRPSPPVPYATIVEEEEEGEVSDQEKKNKNSSLWSRLKKWYYGLDQSVTETYQK